MTNAWDSAGKLAQKHASSGGVFIKLAADGDKVTGVFCGEPYAREVVWTGEKYEPMDKSNPSQKGKTSLRVALNFYVIEENAMKVLDVGNMTFQDILKCRTKYGLDNWSFEIERHGEAGNPKTKYSILPEDKLDAALRQKIASTKLNNLPSVVNGEGDSQPAADGPIDPAVVAELIAQLKVLPRPSVDAILGELGVQRVRDLKASDAEKAKEIVARYSAGEVEIDPFA
jgi:hypothetical protein